MTARGAGQGCDLPTELREAMFHPSLQLAWLHNLLGSAADEIEQLRERLQYALDNIEGCINETDLPSTAILHAGRAALAAAPSGMADGEGRTDDVR